MKKLGLLCILSVIFFSGCGKKKYSQEKSGKAMAQNEATADFLDDGDVISDFAFVDDELTQLGDSSTAVGKKKNSKTPAGWDKNTLVASNDLAQDAADDFLDGQATSEYGFKTVHFEFNKSSVRPDQRPLVEQDCQIAKEVTATEANKKIVVEGHCDQLGSATFNLALSQRRAQTIKNEMVQDGVPSSAIKTIGYGYERPVVFAQIPESLANKQQRSELIKKLSANRRAEILVN